MFAEQPATAATPNRVWNYHERKIKPEMDYKRVFEKGREERKNLRIACFRFSTIKQKLVMILGISDVLLYILWPEDSIMRLSVGKETKFDGKVSV